MKTLSSCFIGVLVFAAGISCRAEEKTFEVIRDMDLGFLMTVPKLPWGDDPFLMDSGYALVPSADEKFVLGGIFFTKDSPMAVVNGKAVREGDVVGDRKIAEIGENYVILRKKNSAIELSLPPLVNRKYKDELDEADKTDESREGLK